MKLKKAVCGHMRVIFDTNIILDVLSNRMPFADDSVAVTGLAVRNKIVGAITSNTVTDIAYQLRRFYPDGAVKMILFDFLTCLEVLTVDHDDCLRACESGISDYEDALLVACAKNWKADYIITRDKKHFGASPIPAVSPEAFLKKYSV